MISTVLFLFCFIGTASMMLFATDAMKMLKHKHCVEKGRGYCENLQTWREAKKQEKLRWVFGRLHCTEDHNNPCPVVVIEAPAERRRTKELLLSSSSFAFVSQLCASGRLHPISARRIFRTGFVFTLIRLAGLLSTFSGTTWRYTYN